MPRTIESKANRRDRNARVLRIFRERMKHVVTQRERLRESLGRSPRSGEMSRDPMRQRELDAQYYDTTGPPPTVEQHPWATR